MISTPRAFWGIAALLSIAAPTASAQGAVCGPGSVEVGRLAFEGNHSFPTAVLASGIVTASSTWARRTFTVFGTRRCLDRQAFPLDVARVLKWYRVHGYRDASVDTVVTAMGPDRVAVLFLVREGEPVRVRDFFVDGLDSVPNNQALLRNLPLSRGEPFDTISMYASRDTIVRRLRNSGYPDAEAFVGYDTHTLDRRADLSFQVAVGPRARIGAVELRVTPRPGETRGITDEAIRRVANVESGALYVERDLEAVKRALYRTEAFNFVRVTPDSMVNPRDSTIGVRLELTEGQMHAVRTGLGWGTLDCFRANADLTKFNLFNGATRLDIRTRVSKLGVGKPVTGLENLCPQAKSDVYSGDLNYTINATVSALAGWHEFLPSVSVFSERRSEYNAYLRTTPVGGNLNFTRALGRLSQSLSYTVEYGRTQAQPALLCAVFNACTQADQASFNNFRRLGVASVSLSRESGDNPENPSRGTALRLELRSAARLTGAEDSLRFNKFLADGAVYYPLTPDIIVAARFRFGAVVGSSFSFSDAAFSVPPQERLFGGGPTTVRGFRQNELGPAVYIPSAYDTVRANGTRGGNPANAADTVYFRARADSVSIRTVPTGGNALVVANLEARIRSPFYPDLIQWTAFADLGQVWNRGTPGSTLAFKSFVLTPGIGVRVSTLIGFIRMDVAHNPYQRATGAAYFDAPLAQGGALFCVSPGNTLRVTANTTGQLAQAAGSCPAAFQPSRESAFFRQLTLNFSIGQAF
jgi:outer membrane protein assembly factor BamA